MVVHPHRSAKSGKFDCTVMSLSVLLDYRPEDNKVGAAGYREGGDYRGAAGERKKGELLLGRKINLSGERKMCVGLNSLPRPAVVCKYDSWHHQEGHISLLCLTPICRNDYGFKCT